MREARLLLASRSGRTASYLLPVMVVAILAILAGCQTYQQDALSPEEAQRITASFAGNTFVPPPRTITDITELLAQEALADPEGAKRIRDLADQPPPQPADREALIHFFYQRGHAAHDVGRIKQAIADLTQALTLARQGFSGVHQLDILRDLGYTEFAGGNFSRGLDYLELAVKKIPPPRGGRQGQRIIMNSILTNLYASVGDLEAAKLCLLETLKGMTQVPNLWDVRGIDYAHYEASSAVAEASLLEVRGRYVEAEGLYRKAVAAVLPYDDYIKNRGYLENLLTRVPFALLRQGRLAEAESEARAALLWVLRKHGRYSPHIGPSLWALTLVLLEQGRYAEAESLARVRFDLYESIGASADSYVMARAREDLAAALVGQHRWPEAAREYEAIRVGLAGEPRTYDTHFARNLSWAVALLHTGQAEQAASALQKTLEWNTRLLGQRHASTAEARGLLAMALAAQGEHRHALQEFAEAARVLLLPALDEEEEEKSTHGARDQRKAMILAAYIGLLADIRGTDLERQAGVDAAAEAFRLADVARSSSVQRALSASAARAAAKTPALAALVREEQDARKQVGALRGVLINALSNPTARQDPKVVEALGVQIETMRSTQQRLAEQIQQEFPAYAELINPAAATVDLARAALRPGEALIATYLTPARSFAWAIPAQGPVAFASVPMGMEAVEADVATLRKALAPNARVLGEIPAFDLAAAHRLYQRVLAPVAAGWQAAESLLVVPHGALAQLPFAVLPTGPAELGPERAPLFAQYRAIPWLARTHAVTVLPSVTSLATLRATPPGPASRRPFVGFGDPFFSREQVQRAERQTSEGQLATLDTRGIPITLRSSPNTRDFDSSQLAISAPLRTTGVSPWVKAFRSRESEGAETLSEMKSSSAASATGVSPWVSTLPRLPETAEEIRGIALAMQADVAKDVFLGPQANEQTVKALELSGYRVLAFATHGLTPGDLDGLVQPALALSAPAVAQVEGDGLLSMDEILGLRLDADWVVLSACNTAAGQGTGAEALSGLGRAFFYAGARALLVSNWPVETTSARALTTELFRLQQGHPTLTRTQALRQTMTWLLDEAGFVDPRTGKVVFAYAHPIFWAPFTLVGDGGGDGAAAR